MYLLISSFPLPPRVFLSTASSSIVLGIRVILDLTPNYKGQNLWFHSTQIDTVATKVKVSVLVLTARGSGTLGLFGPFIASSINVARCQPRGPLLLGAKQACSSHRQKDRQALHPYFCLFLC